MTRMLVVTIAGVIFSILAFRSFSIFSVMLEPAVRCIDISSTDFDRKIDEINSDPHNPEPTTEAAPGTFIIRLQFDINPAWAGDGRFVITSQRTRRVLYNGPYQPVVPVLVDEEMSEVDEGWDNLEFQLLNPQPRRWCSWFTQPGHQFWAKPGTVRIRLMVAPWFDSNELLNEYEVHLP